MCDGDQALTGDDISELATLVRTLPPLLGRELTPGPVPAVAR
jgi:3-deoxy-7-phosphoheptulonate synthase